jgi:hypothetical protein
MKRLFPFILLQLFIITNASATSKLIISQYYEGASNDKFIEIANIGNTAHDFSADPVWVYLFANAAADAPASNVASQGQAISGTLAAGGVLLFKNSGAVSPGYALGATSAFFCNFNGDDLIILSTATNGNTISGAAWAARIDVVGDGSNWGSDISYFRNQTVADPNTNFTLSEWTSASYLSVNTASSTESKYLGTHLYPAPITLIDFSIAVHPNEARLSFSTATEHNNDHFDIERSANGRIFEKIGEVKGAENSIVRQDYVYTDQKPLNGFNYYRLKQVDFDGAFAYSPVRSVAFGIAQSVTVFPTPANSTLTIRLNEALTEDAQWQIMDMTGRIVGAGTFVAETNEYSLPVSTLTEGAYVLQIITSNQVLSRQFKKK